MASGMPGSWPCIFLGSPRQLSQSEQEMPPALHPQQEGGTISFLIFPAKVPAFSLGGLAGVPYPQ